MTTYLPTGFISCLKDHQEHYKILGNNKKKHLSELSNIPHFHFLASSKHFHFLARNGSACYLLWFYVQVNFSAIVKKCCKPMAGDSHLLEPI